MFLTGNNGNKRDIESLTSLICLFEFRALPQSTICFCTLRLIDNSYHNIDKECSSISSIVHLDV